MSVGGRPACGPVFVLISWCWVESSLCSAWASSRPLNASNLVIPSFQFIKNLITVVERQASVGGEGLDGTRPEPALDEFPSLVCVCWASNSDALKFKQFDNKFDKPKSKPLP
jgi:hypothetical protein